MKVLFKQIMIIVVLILATSFTIEEKKSVKCLIQLTNYTGEGAYLVVSLMNPSGAYEETLYVQGDDSEWYSEISSWWNFYGKRRPNIDAITGATVSGGERSIAVLKIDETKIDQGYFLRFETSVEDQEYYETDLEFELTSENLANKQEGTGWIRYVKMLMK